MPYNPDLDEQDDDTQIEQIDINALEDEEALDQALMMRDAVGEDGLTDIDLNLIDEYTQPPMEEASQDHYANLAEFMAERDMNNLAKQVIEGFDWDHDARMEWYYREVSGMRMLGITPKTDGGAKFEGASKVVHPMMAEACVQFQARTMSETWPADGPVRTVVVGDSTEELEDQAKRVAGYMNYQLNDIMPGAYEAEDMALLRLPLSGSVFKKVYFDPVYGHMDDYVAPDVFVVPYNAVDLRTAQRFTHVKFIFPNELKRYQLVGHYLDIDIQLPDEQNLDRPFYKEVQDTEGDTIWEREIDQRHTILEQHVNIDLIGFEHRDADENQTFMELPYIVEVDYDSQKLLSVRRNWEPDDQLFVKKEWFIHKKFTPGFGFYGYGFYHWISSLTKAAIGSLRALMDSAQFDNLSGGYRSKQAKSISGEGPVSPGEFRETELQPEELRNAFFPLPYGPPSNVLFMLMGHLETLGQRFASTTDVLMGEGNNAVPVGTTLARIDQGMKIFGGIHRRIHRANRHEWTLLAKQIGENLPEEGYPFSYDGMNSMIAYADFDERVDVMPVSDPEVVSSSQRIITSQMILEMANQSPDLYDMYQVHRRVLSSVRVPNIDQILPAPDVEPPRRGSVEENMAMQISKPVKARPDEDHMAHQMVHEGWFAGLTSDDQGALQPVYMAHMAEHKAWQYHAQMVAQMGQIPADIMGGDAAEMDVETERALSIAAAQVTQLMTPAPTEEEQDAAQMQSEQDRKDATAQADIERKNAESASEIERKNIESASDINRKDKEADAKLEREQFLAEEQTRLVAQEAERRMEMDQARTAEEIARKNEDAAALRVVRRTVPPES